MLLAFAHPDDESFGMGGTIAKYVAEGADVFLICSTNGDAGTIPEDMRDHYATIADLRLAELDCASQTLGFKEVFLFGYHDSGMMGDEANSLPGSSWHIWQTNPDELIRRVVEVIRQVQPQVVVTFNRYGGYGHPDHIAIQRATEQAFHLAGDATYTDVSLPPYQPQKLYYTNIPAGMIRLGIWITRLRGQDPRKMGVNKDIDMRAILENVEPSHTKVDISDYLDDWERASACHASQGGGRSGFIPRWLRKLLGARQGFTRIVPVPTDGRVDEDDLFAQVTPERVLSDGD
jgi:LmbE family N-acetylglucosaminyl deacetylase